jgi:hypothetical protein
MLPGGTATRNNRADVGGGDGYLLAAALRYASLGYSVVPLHSAECRRAAETLDEVFVLGPLVDHGRHLAVEK